MAQKAIREYHAKLLLYRHWPEYGGVEPTLKGRIAQIRPQTDLDLLPDQHPWLTECRLAAKPDVLAGRRGKHGLILLDAGWEQVKAWLQTMIGTWVAIGETRGRLTHFVVEPYIDAERELYLALKTERHADVVLFSPRGGVDVEQHWQEVRSLEIPVRPAGVQPDWAAWLRPQVDRATTLQLASFIGGLYRYFVGLGFTYLEINPLAIADQTMVPLDLKCRLDDAARFESGTKWDGVEFPGPFGREATPEERLVEELDARSGASLKLTVLNPDGLIWTMVAGGGASVVYTDTIADMGHASELANYGEYSGNPSTDEAYEYARTILSLMTRRPAPAGRAKCLLIGGGIANFTDVAGTFGGIIQGLRECGPRLRSTPVRIWVRRGGPNYQEGLRLMRAVGDEIGVPVEVFGPETHMTRIVGLALSEQLDGLGGRG